MTETITVVSGIPPGESGTGRMMNQLIGKSSTPGVDMRFIYRARPAVALRPLVKQRKFGDLLKHGSAYMLGRLKFQAGIRRLMAKPSGKLLLMHPQTLGFELSIELLRSWEKGKAYIYVLDNSYFCVRSYNYIPGETEPCLRCLEGNFEQQAKHGCEPFPIKDPAAIEYAKALYDLVRDGHVKLMSQNETQKRHIRKHFGPDTDVKVVGLWGGEWTEPFDDWEKRDGDASDGGAAEGPVIIHSFYVPAKGASWYLDVASRCPDIDFLCPFPKPIAVETAPDNVTFRSMTWETGVEEAIANARFVMVPTLWSAPIEGALVKSVVTNPRLAIIENGSAFQSEVPDQIALKLSGDPAIAAEQLKTALADHWKPDMTVHREWVRDFRAFNEQFCDNILSFMTDGHTSVTQPRESTS